MYSGADERTGATRPPAVPVGELLDALDGAVTYPERQDRARPGRPPPAADRRRAQLRAGQARAGATVQLRRARPRRGAHADAGADAPDQPTPGWTAPRERPPRPRGPGVHPGAPGARLRPDAARRDPARRRAGSSTTGCRWSWTASTGGPSATGCCRPRWTASPSTDAGAARAAPRHMPPATLGGETLRQIRAQVEPLLAASATVPGRARDEHRRRRRRCRRTRAHRHGRRRARRRPGPHGLLPAGRPAPPARLGGAGRAVGGVPGPQPSRR